MRVVNGLIFRVVLGMHIEYHATYESGYRVENKRFAQDKGQKHEQYEHTSQNQIGEPWFHYELKRFNRGSGKESKSEHSKYKRDNYKPRAAV